MDISYFIQTSQKNKHLSFEHYEYIVHVVMKHELAHKGKKRNTGRTALIKKLALEVGMLWSSVFVTLVAKKYRLTAMLSFVPRMVCDNH